MVVVAVASGGRKNPYHKGFKEMRRREKAFDRKKKIAKIVKKKRKKVQKRNRKCLSKKAHREKSKQKKRKSRKSKTDDPPTSCIKSMSIAMNVWRLVIPTFQRQLRLINSTEKVINSKANKSDSFKPLADKLIKFGGGDKNGLNCGGNTSSDGAIKLTELTDGLLNCSDKISNKCLPNALKMINTTLVTECENLIFQFNETATECFATSKQAVNNTFERKACDCWNTIEIKSKIVKNCTRDSELNKVIKNLKLDRTRCLNNIRKCKQFESAALESFSACSEGSFEKVSGLVQNRQLLQSVSRKIDAITLTSRHCTTNNRRTSQFECKDVIKDARECKYIFQE